MKNDHLWYNKIDCWYLKILYLTVIQSGRLYLFIKSLLDLKTFKLCVR